ncbi:DUF1488 family protein [Vibrio algarum]|uniref:DUF1488 family protein n=1 Tax=Vibrio algarum TaxID=3020714 RepID=A0ABT4YMW4_9VIBR|nr:DUF1488 family protein [Vibrio sp. KJ40-1]MDB1122556.1 DUF1488 family protein [Vibrio sp. KJ40-1]
MNQAILFPDIQEWNAKLEVIKFPALQSGSLIDCTISLHRLSALSRNDEIGENEVLNVFSEYRFDIEEIAEEMIEDEMFNDLDQIEIS